MSKYYTPEMWEFREDFRYEYKSSRYMSMLDKREDWYKEKYSACCGDDGQSERDNLYNIIEGNFRFAEVRVKCLDEDDIKELGWKINSNHHSCFTFNDFNLDFEDPEKIIIDLLEEHSYGEGEEYKVKFSGKIKNYNELEVLMNQIGISK